MGVDLSDPEVLAPHLTATVAGARRSPRRGRRDDVARRLGDRLMSLTRPEPIGPLAQLRAADALHARHRAAAAAGPAATGCAEDADQVTLTALDRTLTAARVAAARALKTVLAGDAFRPADLPGLDAEEQLTLARRLLREGVIVGARDAAADSRPTGRIPRESPDRCALRAELRGDPMLGTAFPAAPDPAGRAARPVGAGRADRIRLRPSRRRTSCATARRPPACGCR